MAQTRAPINLSQLLSIHQKKTTPLTLDMLQNTIYINMISFRTNTGKQTISASK